MQLQEPKARESLLTPTMRRSSSRTSLATTETAVTSASPSTPGPTASSTQPSLQISTSSSEKSLPAAPSELLSPLPLITKANAALLERQTFAIDNAKDEDEDEDDTFSIGGDDDDQVMDEVDAFLEAHDSGLTAADQELAKGTFLRSSDKRCV